MKSAGVGLLVFICSYSETKGVRGFPGFDDLSLFLWKISISLNQLLILDLQNPKTPAPLAPRVPECPGIIVHDTYFSYP